MERSPQLADRRLLAWLGLSLLGVLAGHLAGRLAKVIAAEATCDSCLGTIDPAFWYAWLATSLLATVVAWKVVKPPAEWPRWFLGNALRFLAAVFASWLLFGVIDVIARDREWSHAVMAPVGGLLLFSWVYFPGLLVYLLVLALLPHGWSSKSRRVAAILLTPVIGAVWWSGFSWSLFERLVLATVPPLVYGVGLVNAHRPGRRAARDPEGDVAVVAPRSPGR